MHTLLAREKSGGPSTKSLYLISTSESFSEVYELEIQQPPTRDDWIAGVREAVDACEDEDAMGEDGREVIRGFESDLYVLLCFTSLNAPCARKIH